MSSISFHKKTMFRRNLGDECSTYNCILLYIKSPLGILQQTSAMHSKSPRQFPSMSHRPYPNGLPMGQTRGF